MKRLLVSIMLVCAVQGLSSQNFGIGISGGYLSEIEGFGGSADLIYEINDKFGISTNATFSSADNQSLRRKWWIVDLNVRYKVYDEWYFFTGGEYLNQTYKELGLGGGNPLGSQIETSGDFYGVNIGTGYKYNLMDNVNVFADAKYVALETGYVHARIGIQFDL